MNREIKFRVWDDTLCHMLEPTMTLEQIAKSSFNGCNWYQLHIMQYTGLKDLMGKEIYEGDIIHHCHEYSDEDDRYIVIWDDDIESSIGGFSFKRIGYSSNYIAVCDTISDYSGEYLIKIIGNIYDNPELLTEYERR